MTALKFEKLFDFPAGNPLALREALQRFEANVGRAFESVRDLLERPFTATPRPIVKAGFMALPGLMTRCDTSAGSFELGLPDPSRIAMRECLVVKLVAANTLTLRPVAGLINGSATAALTAAGAYRIYSDGGGYWR